jgi:CRP-like cAMP-binding protein
MRTQPNHPDRKVWRTEDLVHQALFKDFAPLEDLKRYCPSASVRSLGHRTFLYRQGEPCADALCILEGQVVLSRAGQDWDAFTTGLLFAGDLLGSWNGLEAEEAPESARAKGCVAIWRAPAKEFRNLLLHQPPLCLRLLEAWTRRQQQLERRLEAIVCKRAEARLADTLRELSGRFQTRCEHGFGLHLRVSQQELADLAGASRPVVSTLLNRLRDQGVLGYSREYLCVRDIEVIERLAEKKSDPDC